LFQQNKPVGLKNAIFLGTKTKLRDVIGTKNIVNNIINKF